MNTPVLPPCRFHGTGAYSVFLFAFDGEPEVGFDIEVEPQAFKISVKWDHGLRLLPFVMGTNVGTF